MSIQRRKKPRALTLTLPDEKQPFLLFNGKRYTLRNFSSDGIGLWLIPANKEKLKPGAVIKGEISIQGQVHPVKLEVMHLTERGVGLKLLNKTPELEHTLNTLLEPTSYAAGMIPHKESGKEDSKRGARRLWYTGNGSSELIVWFHENARTILAIQLCTLGRYVFREQLKPAVTGFLKDDFQPNAGTELSTKELLVTHTAADTNLLQHASQFLASVPTPIPGYLLWQFLESGEQVHLPTEVTHPKKAA